jgi:hypothetical protein
MRPWFDDLDDFLTRAPTDIAMQTASIYAQNGGSLATCGTRAIN